MPSIFISYRRDDSAPYAGRLYDRLVDRFGASQVFMDIDHIQPGEDFVQAIHRKVSACDVAIVLIGKNWLDARNASGQRRLDDPEDFVRLEVATALQRNVKVVPVLVGGATMPQMQALPEALALLSRRNAFEISDTRFHADVERLAATLGSSKRARGMRWLAAGGATLSAAVALFVIRGPNPPPLSETKPSVGKATSPVAGIERDNARRLPQPALSATGAGTASVRGGTEPGLRILLTAFTAPDADHKALTQKLKPTTADYEAVFEKPFAAAVQAMYEPLWQSGEAVVRGRPEQTEIKVENIASVDARNWTDAAKEMLPGGYQRIAGDIKAGNTFYVFSFVKPGERLGIRYDVLVYVNGQWRLFPKPWRAKPSAAK